MSASEKHRDLSQLSALLAEQTAAPAKKAAKATITKVSAPANDNKPARQQLAWPAFERLAHRGDYGRLYALRHWKNMVFPGSAIDVPEDENYDEVTIETRPSEGELLGAVGWEIVDRERWHWTKEMVNRYKPAQEEPAQYRINKNGALEAQIGNLLFRDGQLIQWGQTKKGKALKPVERARGAKGGDSHSRSESAIWAYIDLLGAVSPFTASPYTKPISGESVIHDCYSPLPGVEEARQLLRSFGVDGSVPFDQLPFRATRCPRGLVSGEQWVGGVKKPKPLGEISAAAGREPEFVRHVETLLYIDYLRERLGDHAKVLDLAITDASAKDIGIATGLAPAYAEKRGPSLIEAAIDALIDLDETARGQFMPIEEKIAA